MNLVNKVKSFTKKQIFSRIFNAALKASWSIYRPKIYDCIMFFNEAMLFEIRMKEIGHLVDIIVVVESSITFTGMARSAYCFPKVYENLDKNIKRKIRYIQLCQSDYPSDILRDPWLVEEFTRNQITRALFDIKYNDYLIISDIDEIPKSHIIEQRLLGALNVSVSNFKFNLVDLNAHWNAPKAACGLDFMFNTPNNIRCREKCLVSNDIPDAGWHFSFIMNERAILQKLFSFSHQEFDHLDVKNINYIRGCISSGKDLFQRPGVAFTTVSLDLMPRYINDNISEYSEFLQLE